MAQFAALARLDRRIGRHEQGSEAARLSLRRLHDLLRFMQARAWSTTTPAIAFDIRAINTSIRIPIAAVSGLREQRHIPTSATRPSGCPQPYNRSSGVYADGDRACRV